MNLNLQNWIAHPDKLNQETLFELKEMIDQYPYFQTARLLYLKNLYLLNDPSFKEELKRNALYMADLSILFYFIEGEKFTLPKTAQTELTATNSSSRTLDLIDRFLAESCEREQELTKETENSIPMEISVDYSNVLLSNTDQPNDSAQSVPAMKGQDLIDSFLEQTACDSPSSRQEEPTETSSLTMDEETTMPLEEENEESLFTETLAKIYIKQQRYEKALEIIKKLNLKYPKKNVYFADQIRFLEKLIINAKSK